MVAATKKKRGRPANDRYKQAVEITILNHAYNPEISTRAIQNAVNAEDFICLLNDETDSKLDKFFSTENGRMKHNGIAEQIGRMMREGIITDDQAIKIAEDCVDANASGRSSKDIEKELRSYRMWIKRHGTKTIDHDNGI